MKGAQFVSFHSITEKIKTTFQRPTKIELKKKVDKLHRQNMSIRGKHAGRVRDLKLVKKYLNAIAQTVFQLACEAENNPKTAAEKLYALSVEVDKRAKKETRG